MFRIFENREVFCTSTFHMEASPYHSEYHVIWQALSNEKSICYCIISLLFAI